MKKYIIGTLLSIILVLSGCSGSTIEKQVLEILKDMNDAEKSYRDIQTGLAEVEQAEQQLFTETLELTREQPGELKANVAILESQLSERLDFIDKEQSAMEEAKKKVTDLEAVIQTAEVGQKEQLQELENAIEGRYARHAEFLTAYKSLATQQKTLYRMLVGEGVDLKTLEEQVAEVNAQNEVVQAAVMEFNNATEEVNALKEQVLTSLQQVE